MNSQLAKVNNQQHQGALFEKVILSHDVSGLSPLEKVQHIKNMCESLGLNPLTKPIQIHKFDGKEMIYFSKDGTEQLRNVYEVSITDLKTEIVNGLYIVKAFASRPNGRTDISTSVKHIDGLKGKMLENAMKVCETQAKRRVTLSICGLGILDESEIPDLISSEKKTYQPQHRVRVKTEISKAIEEKEVPSVSMLADFEDMMLAIEKCENESQLKAIFETLKKMDFKKHPDLFKQLIDAKDKKKNELMVKEFNQEIDESTGEVVNHE